MRFRLVLISLFLSASFLVEAEISAKALMEEFYESQAYHDYLESDVISAQVMVPVRILSTDEVCQLPNPMLAKTFIEYLSNEHNLSAVVAFRDQIIH